MKITLTYFGQLKQVAGVPSEDVELSDSTGLLDLLTDRADQYEADFKNIILDESGQLRSSIIIAVNGHTVRKDSLPALKNGDEVTLLPPIAGG